MSNQQLRSYMVMVTEEGAVLIWYHNWQHVVVPVT